MISSDMIRQTTQLCDYLGLTEEPFGIFYANTKPEPGFGPKIGVPISRALEQKGEIDWAAVTQNFSCFIGNIWLARKKKCAAYISAEQYGCMGGGYYTGVINPYIEFITYYVSTGMPNTPIHGERYMPSPETMRNFLETVNPGPAPKPYCIAKPLSTFTENESADIVIFFLRPESLSGFFTLASFTTGNPHGVVAPFGAGCTNIVAWPLYYMRKGEEVAVLGGFDPSMRKFMKTDELTFAIPMPLYQKILLAMPDSLLATPTWNMVQRKIDKSKKVWGEISQSLDMSKKGK